jgi:hypothetical protein
VVFDPEGSGMTNYNVLEITVYHATRTDWLTLKSLEGAHVESDGSSTTEEDPFSRHGEPVSTTILLTIATVLSGSFAAWVCKQRAFSRTTLKIEIRDQNGNSYTIDLSEVRYREEHGEQKLVSDLLKAGFKIHPDEKA